MANGANQVPFGKKHVLWSLEESDSQKKYPKTCRTRSFFSPKNRISNTLPRIDAIYFWLTGGRTVAYDDPMLAG